MKHSILRMLLIISVFLLGSELNAQNTSINDNLELMIKKAVALRDNGNAEKAVEILNRAIAENPNSDRAYFELGKTWAEVAQTASQKSDMMAAMQGVNKGFEALDKAIKLNPNNIEARIYYGIFAVNVPSFFGKTEAGIENLEKALALIKNDKDTEITILQFLGIGYRNSGKNSKAVKVWKKALKLNPPEKTAEFIKKNLDELSEKAEISTVKKSFKKADSLDDIDELIGLAEKSLEKGDLKRAEEFALKALKIDNERADLHFLIGKIYQQDAENGYDERIYQDTNTRSDLAFKLAKHFEEAHRLDPDNYEIAVYYATASVMMPFFVGRMDEGIRILENLKERSDIDDSLKTHVLYVLGYAYRKKGNAVWMSLVKNYPNCEATKEVYKEFGLKEDDYSDNVNSKHKVLISFHIGLQDELAPQTAVWIEDEDGNFVKTVYVSGFSGYAKEKQVNLPIWAHDSKFETCGTTGASIDWGKHTFAWDLTDVNGKKVKSGNYTVKVEVSWWPSMRYARAEARILVGKKKNLVITDAKPLIPWLSVEYK